jgi:hypothetical protein
VTVLLLSCAYREQEFITIGYYVSVAYESPEMQEAPPPTPQVDKVCCARVRACLLYSNDIVRTAHTQHSTH